MYEVGGTADLRAEFRVGDVLTNPSSVTLQVRAPDGAVTNPIPQEQDIGIWGHRLQLTQPGLWKWRFTGAAAGSSSGSLRAEPGFDGTDIADYVTLGEISTALSGRNLTSAEADRAQQLVRDLVTVLETVLNRDLVGRTYTNEIHVVPPGGVIAPFHNMPVNVTMAGDTGIFGSWYDTLTGLAPGSTVRVSYQTVGTLAAVPVVRDAVAAALTAGPVAASGAIGSYSVEGTSITYSTAAAGDGESTGRITVGSMRSINRLRVPV